MTKPVAIVEVLAPLVGAAPRAEQPALVALAERVAARRYRAWAKEVEEGDACEALLLCAEREEEIAAMVEALVADAGAIQARFLEAHPDLEARYRGLFEGEALVAQFAIQAEAERAGAATWRAYAAEQEDPAHEQVYRTCAALEEASAEALDSLIASGLG